METHEFNGYEIIVEKSGNSFAFKLLLNGKTVCWIDGFKGKTHFFVNHFNYDASIPKFSATILLDNLRVFFEKYVSEKLGIFRIEGNTNKKTARWAEKRGYLVERYGKVQNLFPVAKSIAPSARFNPIARRPKL